MARGPGTLIVKFDVATAYHNNVLHPDDWYLLGMKWQGVYHVDMALPFGLCSQCHLFSPLL